MSTTAPAPTPSAAAPSTTTSTSAIPAPRVAPTFVEDLRAQVEGPVLLPGEPGFDEEVAGFNVAGTPRPAVVVGVRSAEDVAAAVRAAAAAGLAVSVQATGHGSASAPCDGALLVSTKRLDTLHLNPVLGTAHVGAGVRWAAVIEAAARFGLAPLNGSSPSVGVVGYTLGGGLGPMARRYGFAADRVQAVELVTADGQVRRVDAQSDPELFWGVRGGKGSFGIVTAITFDLVPVARLYGGGLMFDGADAPVVLHAYRRWVADLDEDTTTSIALLNVPDADHVPPPLRGRSVVHLRMAHLGHARDGEEIAAPMRAVAPVLLDNLGEMPYSAVASIHQDPEGPLPAHEEGGLLRELTEEAVDALLEVAGPGKLPLAIVEIRHLGGAIAREPHVPNAVTGRHGAFSFIAIGVMAPEIAAIVPAAAHAVAEALAPWAAEGSLMNFAGGAAGRASLGRIFAGDPETHRRLTALKATVDPADVFRCGVSVAAAPAVPTQPPATDG